jgi:hypothetical protein
MYRSLGRIFREGLKKKTNILKITCVRIMILVRDLTVQ